MPSCPKSDLHDPDYLEYWRDLCRVWWAYCFACGLRDAIVVPHHVRAKRRFGDKNNIVPVCFHCHHWLHLAGYSAIEEKHGKGKQDFIEEAARLYAVYLEEV